MSPRHFLLLLVVLSSLSGCTEYRKVLKSTDMQYKYDMAIKYYHEERYTRAMPLLDELYIIYRGSDKGEKIAYYKAKCDMYVNDYIQAAYRFNQFYETYPNSPLAEECSFLSAYCKYRLSPVFSLDQSDTYDAIRSFQLFSLKYPESSYNDSCNAMLDELRYKIELKEYRNAKLYFKRKHYRAATVSFENFNKRYPTSRHREETYFLAYKAAALLAINSVEEKKVERLEEAIKAYRTFADRFPESEFSKESAEMLENLKKELENFKTLS